MQRLGGVEIDSGGFELPFGGLFENQASFSRIYISGGLAF
jgi:hypothetical protein